MINTSSWLRHPLSRLVQHLVFWVLSFLVFAQLFKTGVQAEKIDYIYTALFHATLLPAVYINLLWLLPRFANHRRWWLYMVAVAATVVLFTWLNYAFFQDWSTNILPEYFFISYFRLGEVSIFFGAYIIITSLLKLSKSWFAVSELQRQLLQAEKEKVQIELKALKAQINPHFFFNTLNGIYAMSLDKDERLPETVLQLSQLMRYFLYESNKERVPLEKEWQVLQDYIALQQIRSQRRLHIEKKVEGEITQQSIAPLLLIIFLENAFKHSADAGIQPAFIRLYLQVQGNALTFSIENNKGHVDEVVTDQYKGMGLENVQRRLALLYPQRHRLEIQENAGQFMINLQLQL